MPEQLILTDDCGPHCGIQWNQIRHCQQCHDIKQDYYFKLTNHLITAWENHVQNIGSHH